MKVRLTQVDSGFVVKVEPNNVVAIMALPDSTRLRMENGVELTVRQTVREVDKLMRGKR